MKKHTDLYLADRVSELQTRVMELDQEKTRLQHFIIKICRKIKEPGFDKNAVVDEIRDEIRRWSS